MVVSIYFPCLENVERGTELVVSSLPPFSDSVFPHFIFAVAHYNCLREPGIGYENHSNFCYDSVKPTSFSAMIMACRSEMSLKYSIISVC